MGLHDSLEEFYGPFTKPTHRMGEWAVCQDEKCGHVSDGIITGMEERATECMIQQDSYWDDSKTLMCSWRGQGKRWGDSVSSAMLLVVEEIKGGQRQKSTSGYSEKQNPKNECYFVEEILQLPPVFSVSRHIKPEHLVLILKSV